jgi:arylsulfatase
VFLMLDTLRADHVGAYGYARDTTPTIDTLAAEGILFENVVAQSSWTQPSLISIFTSRYPLEFGGDTPYAVLPERAETLAERLRDAGWRTAAVVTNPHAHRALGLVQGFERHVYELKAPADRVVDLGIEELDRHRAAEGDAPLFLYLHFMDVHGPLAPPAPFDTRFRPDDGVSAELRPRQRRMVARYDGALRFLDAQIARLLEHLEATGMRDRSLLVVASDHGESHWDRLGLERALRVRSKKGCWAPGTAMRSSPS